MKALFFGGLGLLVSLAMVLLFALLEPDAAHRHPLYREKLDPAPRRLALRKPELREVEQATYSPGRRSPNPGTSTSPTAGDLLEQGREIVYGKGLCLNCHRIGEDGTATLGPDLEGIGARAGSRVPGMSDIEYLVESLYRPEAYVVPGHVPTMMPVNGPPMMLNDEEILAVVAFLQSLGGTPTVTPQTALPRTD